MNNFKYSIVIPAFNSSKFINKAINSVINQTYKNFEMIIINDGSTYDTENVVKSVINDNPSADIKYKYLTNSGVSVARNEGINLASGDFILFLDSDDSYHLELLEKIDKIEEKFDCCIFPWRFSYENEGLSLKSFDGIKSGVEVVELLYFGKCKLNVRSIAYSLSIIKSNKIYYAKNIQIAEDLLFIYCTLVSVNKVIYLNYLGSII